MIEGLIEHVTPDAVVHGWVKATASADICHVQVLYANAPVAETMAGLFRRDLLAAGHGHGHYGFAARLRRTLPHGTRTLALTLPALGISAAMAVAVPKLILRPTARVEDLLQDAPGWTVAELAAHPGCLDAAGNLRRLGTRRFIDAAYGFVLNRWPSKAELRLHAANLDHGRITAEDLLLELLRSEERQDAGETLPSPLDPGFPFTFPQPADR